MKIIKYLSKSYYLPIFLYKSLLSYKLSKDYLINGRFKRIYHYHIRKTGGTSINYAFLKALGMNDPEKYYEMMARAVDNRVVHRGTVVVGWNKHCINSGWYLYGFSHLPSHEIKLPKNTYSFVTFRNPLDRVLSHFKMLAYYLEQGINHPCLKNEKRWLSQDFDYFIENLPKRKLLAQIYMFSEELNVNEAVENASTKCNRILFTENLGEGLRNLSQDLNINIPLLHIRKSKYNVKITRLTIKKLKEMLEPEFYFLKILKKEVRRIYLKE